MAQVDDPWRVLPLFLRAANSATRRGLTEGQFRDDWRFVAMDTYLLTLGAILVAVLAAYFIGAIPYPYGWLILSALLIARWLQLKQGDDHARRG